MISRFELQGRLPGMNDIIKADRSHAQEGAKAKRDAQTRIMWQVKQAMMAGSVIRHKAPVVIFIEWGEPNGKRDVDNVQSGQKFLLDALVRLDVIPNDGQRWVKQVYHHVVQDPEKVGFVRVLITEDVEDEWFKYVVYAAIKGGKDETQEGLQADQRSGRV